jgi:hypothetical protein
MTSALMNVLGSSMVTSVNVWNFNDPNHQARPASVVATMVQTNRVVGCSV